MPVTLYNGMGSAPSTLVRMMAKEAGIDLSLKNVDMANREHLGAEYLKVNPFHKVPAIDDSGFVLYESTAICYYLLNKYAPNSKLLPKDLQKRGKVDQVLATVTSVIQPRMSAFYRSCLVPKKKPNPDQVKELEEGVFKGLEDCIGGEKFAVGDSLTLADLSLIAHTNMFIKLPVLDRKKFAKLVAYYENVTSGLPYLQDICGPLMDILVQKWNEIV